MSDWSVGGGGCNLKRMSSNLPISPLHPLGKTTENDFVPRGTLRSNPLQAFQVILFDCTRKNMSVMREEKSTGWKVRALTGSPDHSMNMMIHLKPFHGTRCTKNASMFALKPLENLKLFVAICVRQVALPEMRRTRNHSKHALLLNRATHAHKKAQEIKVVCPGCCRASLFVPLARRVLASEPLDEVQVPLDGRKLHDTWLALCCVRLLLIVPPINHRYTRTTSHGPKEPLQIVSRDAGDVVS